MLEQLKTQITSLQQKNESIKQEIDHLEMYIKREDIWHAGRKEERDKTDDKVLEFAAKLKVPLQQFLQQRSLQSHRYEKKSL